MRDKAGSVLFFAFLIGALCVVTYLAATHGDGGGHFMGDGRCIGRC